MMIVKHLFRNENKLYGNLMLVLYTKIWKTFVFFVRKPAARFENQNVNPGNNMFPDWILVHQLKKYGTWSEKSKVKENQHQLIT